MKTTRINYAPNPVIHTARKPSGNRVRKSGEGWRMKIDAEIRHVTKPRANLFLELGFPPAEATRLQAASRQQISDALRIKRLLHGRPG